MTHLDSPSEPAQLNEQNTDSLSPDPSSPASARSRFNKDELLRSGYEFLNRAAEFGERTYHRAVGRAAAVTPQGTVGGLCGMMAQLPFTSETILLGYAQGMFPMDKRGKIQWYRP